MVDLFWLAISLFGLAIYITGIIATYKISYRINRRKYDKIDSEMISGITAIVWPVGIPLRLFAVMPARFGYWIADFPVRAEKKKESLKQEIKTRDDRIKSLEAELLFNER